MGTGVAAETPEACVLPLLELAASSCGVPDAFHLGAELVANGYFEAGLVGQWEAIADGIWLRIQEHPRPEEVLLAFSRHPEARVRFHAPGLWARFGLEQAEAILIPLRRLAADEDFRVMEAVQAFGLRPLAHHEGVHMLDLLDSWFRDCDPRVRRAAMTAVRPRGFWVRDLEWARDAPGHLVPVLESFRDEDDRFPANAVANCCNDISRRHPLLAISLLGRWRAESHGLQGEHMVRKGLRSLLKAGDPRVLELFGFGRLEVELDVSMRPGPVVAPNTNLHFELNFRNRGRDSMVDLVYEIQTPGRVQGRPRRKRYQAGHFELPGGADHVLKIRERIFDRKAAPLLEGESRVLFHGNGEVLAEVPFQIQRDG